MRSPHSVSPCRSVPAGWAQSSRSRGRTFKGSVADKQGAATGWHRHEFDYVITPVIGGMVQIEDSAGKRTPFEMVPGVSYFRKSGVEHDVINGPGGELRFVEVELKHRPG